MNGYIKGGWRRRKSPLNCALSVLCPTPAGTVDSKTRGTSFTKMLVLFIPYWRINCKVVPLTVLKCNILNYSKNCYAKNMCGWTYAYYVGVIWRRKTWLAAGQRAEVEYTYSENIDAIAWLTYCFFFSIPARLFLFLSAPHSRHSPLIWTPETRQYVQ